MLKHQVKTLSHRERVSRKPAYKLFEELSLTSSSGSSSQDSPDCHSLSSGPCESQGAPSPTPGSLDGAPNATLHPPLIAMRSCQMARRKLRSTSVSSLSSGSSTSEPGIEWGTLRVYTQSLRADSDYKTMYINSTTSTGELVEMVLAKFTKYRSKLTDPNLFSLTMEIFTRTGSGTVETFMRLEPNSRPLELQSYHPNSRFVLKVEEGVRVRIYDKHLAPELNYKSLLVSKRSTCCEVIKLLIQAQKVYWPLTSLQLVAVYGPTECQQPLPGDERLSYVVSQPWWDDQFYQIHLKPVQYFRMASKLAAANGAANSSNLCFREIDDEAGEDEVVIV